MDTMNAAAPSLPLRAWRAVCDRGPRYAWHKALRRATGRWPTWKRRLVYGNPREYWTLRGGFDYFREQEGQVARGLRAEWVAGRIASYRPTSVLEVGCGYGKLLKALRERTDAALFGVDFSPTQLGCARGYLSDVEDLSLFLARGDRLPFADNSFDLVVTSAVILHNPPEVADRIRREVVRVARRFAAHNEEMNLSYNRYGYDTAAWYRDQGRRVAEVGPIPMDADPQSSQFCVARLDG